MGPKTITGWAGGAVVTMIDDDTGPLKITEKAQVIAANQAIINSKQVVRFTPGMFETMNHRQAQLEHEQRLARMRMLATLCCATAALAALVQVGVYLLLR